MRRAVESRNLVSFVVSAALGLYLFRSWPFPAENDLLQMVLLQKPYLFYGIKYGFVAMLFSTPYIAFSILFSFTYIFVMRREEQIGARRLAPYLPPESRNDLYLVVGELHHPKRPQPRRLPGGSLCPSMAFLPGSPSSARWEAVRPRDACIPLPSRCSHFVLLSLNTGFRVWCLRTLTAATG